MAPKLWSGARDATKFGPICIQRGGAVSDVRVTQQSEDCLYLNVWTPTLRINARHPVMLWIHDGGNLGGAGSEVDIRISNLMQTTWVELARTGVPASPNGKPWPRYTHEHPQLTWIEDEIAARPLVVSELTNIIHSLRADLDRDRGRGAVPHKGGQQ